MQTRRQIILEALETEIERQAHGEGEQLDLMALAGAVDSALDEAGRPDEEIDDGKTPAELNASNDV